LVEGAGALLDIKFNIRWAWWGAGALLDVKFHIRWAG
jgi:hypothetical protein